MTSGPGASPRAPRRCRHLRDNEPGPEHEYKYGDHRRGQDLKRRLKSGPPSDNCRRNKLPHSQPRERPEDDVSDGEERQAGDDTGGTRVQLGPEDGLAILRWRRRKPVAPWSATRSDGGTPFRSTRVGEHGRSRCRATIHDGPMLSVVGASHRQSPASRPRARLSNARDVIDHLAARVGAERDKASLTDGGSQRGLSPKVAPGGVDLRL
jgi:hypothetical protein